MTADVLTVQNVPSPESFLVKLRKKEMFTVTYQDQSGSLPGPEMIKHSKLIKQGKEEELTKLEEKCKRTE